MANTKGGIEERDGKGSPFNVGDYVMVRCLVTNLTPVATGGNGGPADLVALTVETPGNVGEQQNVTLTVSPVQCWKAGSANQA